MKHATEIQALDELEGVQVALVEVVSRVVKF